jgi:hypothetical protein
MKTVLEAEQELASRTVEDLRGPGPYEKWLYWKTQTDEQVWYV